MNRSGWITWTAAFVFSAIVHVALTLGLRTPATGAPELPSGVPTTMSGSLAGLLGDIQDIEAVDPTEVSREAPAETVQSGKLSTPVAVKVATVSPLAATPAKKSALAPIPSEQIAARSSSSDPVVMATEVSSNKIDPTSSSVEAAESAAAPQARRVTPQKPIKSRRKKEPTRGKPTQSKRRKLKARDAVQRQRRKAHEGRKRSSRSGTSRQGTASASSGGRRGRARASHGSVQNYGARVRARILSNRPAVSGIGRTVISFGVSTNGRLRYARVSKSSGISNLDRSALIAVRRAAPYPRPPAGASVHQLRFSISFSFR